MTNMINYKKYIVPLAFLVLTLVIQVVAIVLVNHFDVHTERVEMPRKFLLSKYDSLFQDAGEKYNIDWRLLCAIAQGESHFKANAVSARGAMGLMQVMPSIAERMGVSRDSLIYPATNIDVSARLLKSFNSMIRRRNSLPQRDRWAFLLTCYNSGYGHLSDARALAEYYGENPDSWEDVSPYLVMLSDSLFFSHDIVVNGRFREGDITVAYVNKVLRRYDRYVRRTE